MSKLLVPSVIVVLLLALGTITAACGDGGEELTIEEYFQQTEAIFDEATEQSEASEEKFDLEEGGLEDIRDYFGEFVSIIRDASDELDDIDPPAEVEDAHNEFSDALEAFAEGIEDVVDQMADVETEAELEAVFGGDADFDAAAERMDAACLALQDIADENDIDVDLDCGD